MSELKKIKAVFFGTSDFAVPILNALRDNLNLVAVVTQPDRPAGRAQEMTESPVKAAAKKITEISLYQFESLKDMAAHEQLKALSADIFVVAAYGKIIPQNILDIPAQGSINVHGSVLPKYRGASPIHAALLNGDDETGNTIMVMDAEMDHGPILSTSVVKIDPSDDFKSLEKKMSEDGSNLLIETLSGFVSGKITPREQDHAKATYTKLLVKNDGLIDWSNTPSEIINQWRAFKYWPGVFTYFLDKNGKKTKLRLDDIKKSSETEILAGQAVFTDGRIVIGAGQGAIEVVKLTPEGKKTMTAAEFINGFQYLNGASFVEAAAELPK